MYKLNIIFLNVAIRFCHFIHKNSFIHLLSKEMTTNFDSRVLNSRQAVGRLLHLQSVALSAVIYCAQLCPRKLWRGRLS